MTLIVFEAENRQIQALPTITIHGHGIFLTRDHAFFCIAA